ncbi:MAG: M48 family metalloprotease [Candidatus Parvarchaeota archaeon]|nr:M48 family metalloprotease [Candidatus Parvarchaeum tengchongense]MCW1298830.1 M48 family metalloprotease [Candidatus Parvarchaeum tengchongense]MCW1312846.1 M48 family metalloprotease [Candidatus Parvarchaeum tengchongense]
MTLNEYTIKKELRKLTDKDIKIIINSNKKKRDIHSFWGSIHFNGRIDFGLTELDGALAHEIAHIKGKHKFYLNLFAIGVPTIIAIPIIYLYLIKNIYSNNLYFSILVFSFTILFFGAILLLYHIVGRHYENLADEKAAERVGKVPVIRALEKISTWKEANKCDLTHDKPEKRIEHVKKLDLPDFIKIK